MMTLPRSFTILLLLSLVVLWSIDGRENRNLIALTEARIEDGPPGLILDAFSDAAFSTYDGGGLDSLEETELQSTTDSARWLGMYVAPSSGQYRFRFSGHGHISIRLDGELLLNENVFPADPLPESSSVSLVGGKKYTLRIEYVPNSGIEPLTLLKNLNGGSFSTVDSNTELRPYLVDMNVDTDRDGQIDSDDDDGEDGVTLARGAIANTNFDRDGSLVNLSQPVTDSCTLSVNGSSVHEDKVINGVADKGDITPLVVGKSAIAGVPGYTTKIIVSAADSKYIHLFKKVLENEQSIYGGLTETNLEVDISAHISAGLDVTMGVEPLAFRGMQYPGQSVFDGKVKFRVVVTGPSGDLDENFGGDTTMQLADEVEYEVAPIIFPSNLQTTNQVFVGAYPDSLALVSAIPPSVRELVTTINQWCQDHVQFGFTNRPGQNPMNIAWEMPYVNLYYQWLYEISGCGAFSIGRNFSADSGDFGGNFELLPPGPGFPFGKVILGTTCSTAVREFLQEQGVQPVAQVPTQWLRVGHVDEVYQLISGTPGQSLMGVKADPGEAYAIMDALTSDQRRDEVLFAIGERMPIQLTLISQSPPGSPSTYLLRGTNSNATSTPYKYIRVLTGAARGLTAEVLDHNAGNIVIGRIWLTSSLILSQSGSGLLSAHTQMQGQAPAEVTSWPVGRQPVIGDRIIAVEDSMHWHSGTGAESPALISVQEILDDAALRTFNLDTVQPKINSVISSIEGAAAYAGSFTWHKAPTIFVGDGSNFDTGRSAVAFSPGLANCQVAPSTLIFPMAFGPGPVGLAANYQDRFQQSLAGALANEIFVDDWKLYHRRDGEVHCATATLHQPISSSWWSIRSN